MAFFVNSIRSYFSNGFCLLVLIILITLPSSLALNTARNGSRSWLNEEHVFTLEDATNDTSGVLSNEFVPNRGACFGEGHQVALEDQVKLLDKCLGRPIVSSTLEAGRTKDTISLLKLTKYPIHIIPLNSNSTAAVAFSSSKVEIKKNAFIAKSKTHPLGTIRRLKDTPLQGQKVNTTTLYLNPLHNHEETDRSRSESLVDPLQHPRPPIGKSLNTQKRLEMEVSEVSKHNKMQLHSKQNGLNHFSITNALQEIVVKRDEYNTMIPITLYGTSSTVVSFKGHKDHVLNVVLQLRGRRYDSTVPEFNCENTRIAAQLRVLPSMSYMDKHVDSFKSSSTMLIKSNLDTTEKNKDTHTIRRQARNGNTNVQKLEKDKASSSQIQQQGDTFDDSEELPEGDRNRLWNSFAQLFDTSLLCEVLPSLSLRVSKVKKEETFNFIIQSIVEPARWSSLMDPDRGWPQNAECSMHVYISQTLAKQLRMSQILFAVMVPLLVLFVPLPFFLRRADIIQTASLNVDVVDSIWYPPYLLRKIVISGSLRLSKAMQMVWHRHKRRRLQKRLEMQQRALSAQMNAAMEMSCFEASRADVPFQTDVGGFSSLTKQPQESRITLSPSTWVVPEAKVAIRESFPNDCEKNNHSITLVNPPAQSFDEDSESSRGLLCRPGTSFEPATASVVVKSTSCTPTEGSPTLQLHREYDNTIEHNAKAHITEPALKQDIVSGSLAKPLSKISPCVTGAQCLTTQELLFTPNSCASEDKCDIEEEERFCRICRDGDENETLVAPCNCTGSVRWVHLSCLDHWRVESIKRNMNNVNTCEICKTVFKVKIRRSTLIWHSCKRVVSAIILIISCMLFYVMLPVISHGVFGELSCVAEYHHVPYKTMYQFDSIMLSFFLYVELILSVIFARLIVYSWFRSNPVVEAYIAEVHVVPQFMTWRNILKIALVTLVLIAQAISTGYLVKVFMYASSDIVWNWEASPLLGGVIFIMISFFGIGISASMREHWFLSGRAQRQVAAVDVVVEEPNANNNVHSNQVVGVEGVESR